MSSFSINSPRSIRVAPAPVTVPAPAPASAPTTPTLSPDDGSNMPLSPMSLLTHHHAHTSSTVSASIIFVSIPSPTHVHSQNTMTIPSPSHAHIQDTITIPSPSHAHKYEMPEKNHHHHHESGDATPVKVDMPSSSSPRHPHQLSSCQDSHHHYHHDSMLPNDTKFFLPKIIHPDIFHVINQSSSLYSTSQFISRVMYLLFPTILVLVICCGVLPLGQAPSAYSDARSFMASLSLSTHYHLIILSIFFVMCGGPLFLLAGASAINQYDAVTWTHLIGASILVAIPYLIMSFIILGAQTAFPGWILLPYSTLYPSGFLCGMLFLRDARPSHPHHWSLYKTFWFRYTAVVIVFPACVLYLALFFSAPSDGSRIALLISFSVFQYIMRDTIRYLMPSTTTLMMRVLSPFWVTLVAELIVTASFPQVHDISTFALVAILQLCTHLAHPLTFTRPFFHYKQRFKKFINFQGQYGWNQPYHDYLLRTCNDYFFTLLAQFVAHVLFIIIMPCMRYGYSAQHWPLVESMMPAYNFRVAMYFGAIQCVSCLFQLMFAQYWIRRVWQIDVIALASYCLQRDGLVFALACCTCGPILMSIVLADCDVLFYFVPWG